MALIKIEKRRFDVVFQEMCEEYCFFNTVSKSEEVLRQHCDECPLNNIECDDYWVEKEKNG